MLRAGIDPYQFGTLYIIEQFSIECGRTNTKVTLFSNAKPIVFLHSLFLKNKAHIGKKKNQANVLKFISSQLAKFGLVLSKTENRPKLSLTRFLHPALQLLL